MERKVKKVMMILLICSYPFLLHIIGKIFHLTVFLVCRSLIKSDKAFTDWQISILYNSFYLDCAIQLMSDSTSKSEATQLENTTYNILAAVGKDADFLYSTIGTYIKDAQNANRSDLVDMWNTIKQDRQRHLQMLRQALEKEAKEQKLSK
jgi:hypothetical protein